jgi:hypothetical protein
MTGFPVTWCENKNIMIIIIYTTNFVNYSLQEFLGVHNHKQTRRETLDADNMSH